MIDGLAYILNLMGNHMSSQDHRIVELERQVQILTQRITELMLENSPQPSGGDPDATL